MVVRVRLAKEREREKAISVSSSWSDQLPPILDDISNDSKTKKQTKN